MKERRNKHLKIHGKQLVAFAMAASTMGLFATGAYATTTYIKVHNCSDSHHEVLVEAGPTGDSSYGGTEAKIHSGDSAEVYCKDSACDVKFISGSYQSHKDDTSESKYYVHVKKSHTMHVSTSESEVCGSEG